jgi:hypothetical protein
MEIILALETRPATSEGKDKEQTLSLTFILPSFFCLANPGFNKVLKSFNV